jgi:flagellar motor switch protein FliN
VENNLATDALLDVKVRLSAELGRARMPLAAVVALGDGAIVDLDRMPDDPIEVFANGRLVGKGRLVLADGEWALRLEEIDFRRGSQRPEGAGDGGQSVEQPSNPPSDSSAPDDYPGQ